jgi:hypothetical protein
VRSALLVLLLPFTSEHSWAGLPAIPTALATYRATPSEEAAEALMLAIATARNEYAFLHFEARRLKIDEAVNRNSSLFDQEAAARLRLPALANLAEATPEIVSFDRVTSFQDRRHSWILAVPQKPLPASAKLIQAATQVETRFAALDPFIQGA